MYCEIGACIRPLRVNKWRTYIHIHIYTYTYIRLIPVLAEGQFTQLGVSLLSGAVAGVIATVVSQPADAVLTRMKVCVCVSMCLCTNTLLHTHLLERTLLVRAREYACIAARTRTHTRIHAHTRACTHTHTNMQTHTCTPTRKMLWSSLRWPSFFLTHIHLLLYGCTVVTWFIHIWHDSFICDAHTPVSLMHLFAFAYINTQTAHICADFNSLVHTHALLFVCVCMYVYVRAHVCVALCVQMCAYVYIRTQIYVYLCLFMCVHIYVYVCSFTCVYKQDI